MKRNNLRNLFSLLLVVLSLYLLDNTKLNKYVGYEKVKEYIKTDINIFGIAKGFFGDKIYSFYNLTTNVSTTIIKKEKYGDGYLVYQNDNYLYSTYVGSVIKIVKEGDYYSIVISKENEKILYKKIVDINVSLYQKIEADTLIGTFIEFYYYEEI